MLDSGSPYREFGVFERESFPLLRYSALHFVRIPDSSREKQNEKRIKFNLERNGAIGAKGCTLDRKLVGVLGWL
jgi:hypothetical protein